MMQPTQTAMRTTAIECQNSWGLQEKHFSLDSKSVSNVKHTFLFQIQHLRVKMKRISHFRMFPI